MADPTHIASAAGLGGRRRRFLATAALLLLLGGTAPGLPKPAGAATLSGGRSARATTAKPRRTRRLVPLPRVTAAVAPHLLVVSPAGRIAVGARFTVRVRMQGSGSAAHHAAFTVGADPSIVRFVGYETSTRGALIAEPHKSVPGLVAVYRSALPEGFATTEDLVDLEYEAVSPGTCSIVLTDVRIMDGKARSVQATHDSGSVDVF